MSISEAEIFDVKLRTKKKVKVLTLNTNSQARAMVGIDLQVLKAIRNSGANTVSELLETERVKRLGLSREGLIECLKRLEEIGKLEAKNFFLEYSGKSIKMK